MPDDDLDWTCKHLIEPDECWRHMKSKVCECTSYEQMTRCKEFKRVMKW